METMDKNLNPPAMEIRCPYCEKDTAIKAFNNFKTFYSHCLICSAKFVVEPIRDGVNVYTLSEVPYDIDPDSQALEMGQSAEE